MAGNCPWCKAAIVNLKVYPVEALADTGSKYAAITLFCPSCQAVLGCQLDPVKIATDTANMIRNPQQPGIMPFHP
jgi:hypothetical protein